MCRLRAEGGQPSVLHLLPEGGRVRAAEHAAVWAEHKANQPPARKKQKEKEEEKVAAEEGLYVVKAIHGERVEEEEHQYLIEWKGYRRKKDWTWHSAADLTGPDSTPEEHDVVEAWKAISIRG